MKKQVLIILILLVWNAIAACGSHVVSSLQPNTGDASGGTTVLAFGSGFFNVPGIQCKFGNNTASVGTFISSTIVKCVSANNTVPGVVPVEIDNGIDGFSNNNVSFYYTGIHFMHHVNTVLMIQRIILLLLLV